MNIERNSIKNNLLYDTRIHFLEAKRKKLAVRVPFARCFALPLLGEHHVRRWITIGWFHVHE